MKGNKTSINRICSYVFLLLMIVSVFLCTGCHGKEQIQGEVRVYEQLPYEVEGLQLDSLFQFTGSNPDNELTEGENIAGLTVTNTSDRHLMSAEIRIMLGSGSRLEFTVEDLPARQSVNVFEKNNTDYDLSDGCESIAVQTTFSDEDVFMSEQVHTNVEETVVTVTNVSDEVLENLVIHCHCTLDDTYFGGLTYDYPVEKIEAGESILVDATDCYLGKAEVVRISQKN